MKKIRVLLMLLAVLTVFNGCQKDEPVLVDEQPQIVVKPDVYAENGYLVFKDHFIADSIRKILISDDSMLSKMEKQFSFMSAKTFLGEKMSIIDNLPEEMALKEIEFLSSEGYFDTNNIEFCYPFRNETWSVILNKEGKVKIGKVIYKFEGNTQIMNADTKDYNLLNNVFTIDLKHVQMNLKSAEVLKSSTTADGIIRLEVKLERDYVAYYDWIIHPIDGIVWGYVGSAHDVYLRFWQYNQRWYGKFDRATLFFWKVNNLNIGGNNGYYHHVYNPVNPFTEQTYDEKAKHYLLLYSSGFTASTIKPNVYTVNADCWSRGVPAINSIIFP